MLKIFKQSFFILVALLGFLSIGYGQNNQRVTVAQQSWDGSLQTSFTATPGANWVSDGAYSVSASNSIHAFVPSLQGAETYLVSDIIDISPSVYPPNGLEYVELRFSHICKISPLDTVKIQYRHDLPGAVWADVPSTSYKGTAENYARGGFNADSYSIWNAADSTVFPSNSWWMEEVFDLSHEVGFERFQIRFYIKKGATVGTDISYGWNIDNFLVVASSTALINPDLSFENFYSGNIYFTGEYPIVVNAVSKTSAPLESPILTYSAVHPTAGAVYDTLIMTALGGNLYQAVIPPYIFGTEILYSVYAADTAGNYTRLLAGFTSEHATVAAITDSIQIGSGSGQTPYFPWTTAGQGTNWSRALYKSADIGSATKAISLAAIGYNSTTVATHTRHGLQCYVLPTVDQQLSTANYEDPIAAGAIKVFEGDMTTTQTGWSKVDFQNTVMIPQGMNVIVWWLDTSSANVCANDRKDWETFSTSYPSMAFVSNYWGNCSPYYNGSGLNNELPVTRFYFGSIITDSNSVAMQKIDVADTILTSPSLQTNVNAIIKNKGYANLTTATIGWTLNGATQTPAIWNGNIPDDFNATKFLGTYNPKVNGYDTIKMWVSMPNGVTDIAQYDDTLIKYVYGAADLEIYYVSIPNDTVLTTGPHEIIIAARSLTGQTIANLALNVTIKDTTNAIISTYNLPLNSIGNNRYNAYLQNIPFYHAAYFSLSTTDVNANVVTLSEKCMFVKFLIADNVDSTNTSPFTSKSPTCTYQLYWESPPYVSQTRNIYRSYELGDPTVDKKIKSIAFYCMQPVGSGVTTDSVFFYLKAVNDSSYTTPGSNFDFYVNCDSVGLGYSLVLGPTVSYAIPVGWNVYTLTEPFVLPAGKNLELVCNRRSSIGAVQTPEWAAAAQAIATTLVVQDGAGIWPPWDPNSIVHHGKGGIYEARPYRPELQIVWNTVDPGPNSVKLEQILSPVTDASPVSTPIEVIIRNMGSADLDSCDISYSINGGAATVYHWVAANSLSRELVDTVVIGYYTPVVGSPANIEICVSNPNGDPVDSIANDDCLSVYVAGCNGAVSGSYTVGSGGNFSSFTAFVQNVQDCGISGNVTLNLINGTYNEQLDLSVLSGLMQSTDTLTIQSQSGVAANVNVIAASGSAVKIGGNANVYIKNITLTANAGHGVEIAGACGDLEISGCIINASTTATSESGGSGIYYANSAATANGFLHIINNTINRGGMGIFINNWHKTSAEKHATTKYLRITNNTIEDFYSKGVAIQEHINCDSVAYNVVQSRAGVSVTTKGLEIGPDNDNLGIICRYIINNKINMRANNSSQCMGLQVRALDNESSSIPACLIANNEIRKTGACSDFRGIYYRYTKARIVNNSIYSSGTNTTRSCALYISGAVVGRPYEVKNNIFSIFDGSGTPYALHASSATDVTNDRSSFDYNNYYSAGTKLADIAGAISTLAGIQSATTGDANSVNVQPSFPSVATDLRPVYDMNMLCPIDPDVTYDLTDRLRTTPTFMGGYQPDVYPGNATLVEFIGLSDGTPASNTDSLKVRLVNGGSTPLTSITMGYSHNGVAVNNITITLSDTINMSESTIVNLGAFTYAPNNNDFVVWVTSLNSGLADSYNNDDTLKKSVWVCTTPYSGTFTVGNGQFFESWTDAFNKLNLCSVIGDITLQFATATYSGDYAISDNANFMGNHKLTLTSISGNNTDVVFSGKITLTNVNNLTINGLTIGNYTTYSNVIRIDGTANNLTIENCNLLSDTNFSASATFPKGAPSVGSGYEYAVINRPNQQGLIHYVTIKNNYIAGGYRGLNLWGMNNNDYNTHIVVEGNTFINQFTTPMYLEYNSFDGIHNNTIISHHNSTYCSWASSSPTSDAAIRLEMCNGNITGNKILKRYVGGDAYAISLNIHHTANVATGDTALIANNEIIMLNGSGNTRCIQIAGATLSKIVHNSLFIDGTGGGNTNNRGIYFNVNFNGVLKNNLIYTNAAGSYPVYFSTCSYGANTQIGYNCYYSPSNVSYCGGGKTTWADWILSVPADTTSVYTLPDFINEFQSLELNTYDDTLLVPAILDVYTDITGKIRMSSTTMGAYAQPLQGQDLMLVKVLGVNSQCIENQSVSVDVEALNAGLVTLNSAVLGWSVNSIPQANVPVTFSPALTSMSTQNIHVGNFTVTAANNYDIHVWIVSINGETDTLSWNDNVYASTSRLELTNWASPLIGDTVTIPTFDVYAKIETLSGAPATEPKLQIISLVNGRYEVTDSVLMTRYNDITWKATVPQQYYGSKVKWSLNVTDTIGNNVTLWDSTYVKYDPTSAVLDYFYFAPYDSLGGIQTASSVLYTYYNTSWSRYLYLNSTLEPALPVSKPTTIRNIAFRLSSTSSYNRSEVRIYFKATNATTMSSYTYVDPITDGATLVYKGPMNLSSLWVDLLLDQTFTLPAGSNLMIYINDNSSGSTGSTTWRAEYSKIKSNTFGCWYINNSTYQNSYSPVTRFGRGGATPYQGYDLGITNAISPVNVVGDMCAPLSLPLQVAVNNFGEEDYDFSVNPIAFHVEITKPVGVDTLTVYVNSGVQNSGASEIVELIPSLSLADTGIYNIKIWLDSPVDLLPYDDTLEYTYLASRMLLPVDENFSYGIPHQFENQGVNTNAKWQVVSQGIGSDNAIVPDNGDQMLAFGGARGAVTRLSTSQLDISNAYQPTLTLWYYQDTGSHTDYTDVYITTDGGATFTTLLSLTKGSSQYAIPEWIPYSVDLSPYQNGQCIFIVIQSMSRSQTPVYQYIDRIRLSAKQDMALGNIITDEITACDLNNKSIKVVLSNLTSQAVNYDQYPTTLYVSLSGAITKDTAIAFTAGTFAGMKEDTISIWSGIDYVSGNYILTAYFDAVDENLLNDSLTLNFSIDPKLTVEAINNTNNTNAPLSNMELDQEMIIRNSGNMDIEDLIVEVAISDNSAILQTIKDTVSGITLAAGDSLSYIMSKTYTVPKTEVYNVVVTVNLLCNNNINATSTITEYADLRDIELLSIETPTGAAPDTAGKEQYVSVKIQNNNPENHADNILLHLTVKSGEYTIVYSDTATISVLAPNEMMVKTFARPYTVPNLSTYEIVVYVDSQDQLPFNDTLVANRTAIESSTGIDGTSANGLYLSQNQPNPAIDATKIEYALPHDGKVVFSLYTVAGQVMRTYTVDAVTGIHSLTFDIAGLSSGIYFYSMEFEGQKLVRKMTVK
ncbi:MAG: T9SS type A sorting domain-containing protein [Bacteroidales bacterium]|jgi:hypothetical protein|nr:T9SS type A sorting domain-containing protein [Bacteroidales bacterium]